ncbi:MAG: hypothetical protein E6H07_07785 [Bacteroidetes bacterium]|nr:MAG: hypothetical protein E6H07_07785 [Bacteroidota bacterium]
MKLKSLLAPALGIIILSSCGESSTESATSDVKTDTSVNKSSEVATNYSTTTVVVPEKTKKSFETKYPKASNTVWTTYQPIDAIEWTWYEWPSMDTSDYMVTYNLDGSNYWTWYDDQGEWIRTVTNISDFTTLPAAVTKTLNSQFDGFTIKNVDKENDKNTKAYEIDLEKGTDKMKVLVSESGMVMKKKGTMGGVEVKEKL